MIGFPVAAGRFPEAKTVTADGSQPLLAGGSAKRPVSLRTGAEPRHHEHRSPGTSVPTDARGVAIDSQIDRPAGAAAGQNTSSQGVCRRGSSLGNH